MDIDVFISHHTDTSLHIVEAVVNRLESEGIRCWYAPRDTEDDYAGSIVRAINSCRVFLLVLNKDASESVHVLNELNTVTKRLSKKDDVHVIPFHVADDDISEAADYYIGRMHWIDAKKSPITARIDELVVKIEATLGKVMKQDSENNNTKNELYRLISKKPLARSVFYGRDTEINEIDNIMKEGKRVVFVEGIGGIGKSEIAKQYALKHDDEYDNILFVTYTGSLKKLVCDSTAIDIENLSRGEESEDEFFEKKMKTIRSICDEKTLIIVDNFDVDGDDDLQAFTDGTHRVIFTTRNRHSGYSTIRVEPIFDESILVKIFEENYGEAITSEDLPWVRKIFKFIENHTYMIELIAKQMEASFLSAQEMYGLLSKGKLQANTSEKINGRKETKTAFEHLMTLFSMSNLTEEEKRILKNLSLMGTKGIQVKCFKTWSNLSDMNVITQLIRKSWIRKENGQIITLHPLMAEVVKETLKSDLNNTEDFLWQIALFAHGAWRRSYQENLAVAENIYSILSYFSPFDAKGVKYFEPLISFLWQVGRFNESIQFGHELYDSCLIEYGEASVHTGFVAKSLGGCYFNSRRQAESVKWYEQGLKSMLLAKVPEGEDLAQAYSKVARCYTWDCSFDKEKAVEYFNISLNMRKRARDCFYDGISEAQCYNSFTPYTVETAESLIAQVYLEMGRMYQCFGEYEKALEYAVKCKTVMEAFDRDNMSSYAYAIYDMGCCYLKIGLELKGEERIVNFLEAEKYLKQSLEMNLKMRGYLALDTIENQEILGDLYVSWEKFGEAANAYMAVITMLEKLYGSDSEKAGKIRDKMMFNK